MESKFDKRMIALKDLVLWDENARFPDEYFNKTEEELVDYFLSSEKRFKMKKFAEAIVRDFDLPQLEKIIVYDFEDKLIVLEGNRRLSIYKSIISPEIVKKKELQNYFIKLRESIEIDNSFKLECLVTSDLEQGLRFIDRKHIQSNNEVSWGDAERAHHNARRGIAKKKEYFRIAISKMVKSLDIPDEFKNDVLGKGYVTTFFRILDSTAAWEKYGFQLDSEGNISISNKDFKEELKVIILNVLQKKDFNDKPIHSRALNKTEEIEEYITNIQSEDSQKVIEEIEKKTEQNLFDEKIINITPSQSNIENSSTRTRSKPMPTGLFFSTDVPYKIDNKPLRILYNELKDIDVASFPNATLDLLRSFIECSLIVYYKRNNEFDIIQKNEKHNPTLGEMLAHIINGNCKAITDVNLIETIKQIKTDYDKPYSFERLNMINHNENWTATEKDVRSTWGKIESLFKIILAL
ncbi:MAG: hypothetical protein KKB34_19555 [Bacteroidetes bacterium]|nr:hypothetical protein [Bacteroidota bacterium]